MLPIPNMVVGDFLYIALVTFNIQKGSYLAQ